MTKKEEDAENNMFHINGRRNGKDLFYKKVKALEQRCLKRELRPDEILLLIMFDSTKVTGVDEKDLFSKKAEALEKRFGRELRLSEALLIALFDSLEVVKADEKVEEEEPCGQAGNLIFTLALLAAALEADLEGVDLEKMKAKAKANECCCDKCDEKNDAEKEKKTSNHEFSDAIAEAALEICGIDLKKGV